MDLVGGYYDAGDNVKFGLPMAFTVTMLSWSVLQYPEQIAAAGEYRHALEAIKWGTDYFIKAHPQPHVLWVQVINPSIFLRLLQNFLLKKYFKLFATRAERPADSSLKSRRRFLNSQSHSHSVLCN